MSDIAQDIIDAAAIDASDGNTPSLDDTPAQFEPFDLAPLFLNPPEPSNLIGSGLLYPGGLHSMYGEPEGGKTTLALWTAAGLLAKGERVLFIDEESGPEQTVDRLIALGVTAEQAQLIDYHPFPGRKWTGADIEGLLIRLREIRPVMALVDSVSGVMSAAGLEENSNAAASHLFKRVLLAAARESSAAVVGIDHVTKDGAGGRYARGAGAKLGLVDVGLHVEAVKPFSRQGDGLLVVTRRKDRRGWLPRRWECRVATGGGKLDLDLVESADDPAAPALRPAERKLLDALIAAAPDAITSRQAVDRVVRQNGHGLRRETASRGLAALVDLGLVDRLDGKPTRWLALSGTDMQIS